MAAIHTEEQFEDEICEVLKAKGWLCRWGGYPQ